MRTQVGELLQERKWVPPSNCSYPKWLVVSLTSPFHPHIGCAVCLVKSSPDQQTASEMAFYTSECCSSHFPMFFFFFQSFGFNLLPCSNYHWQLSFLRAEQVLLEQLDEDGGCRRKCFQVMRQLKEDVWCPGNRPVITSHHLQVSVGQVGEGPGAALDRSFSLWPL